MGGYVARLTELISPYKMLQQSLNGRDHMEELGIDGRIILQ
jgi:hypothetical protein